MKEKTNEYLSISVFQTFGNFNYFLWILGRELFQVFSYETQIGKKALSIALMNGKKKGGELYVLRYIKELLEKVDQQVNMLVVFYTAPVI